MKVLLLAGTSGARRISEQAADFRDVQLIGSLAGVTRRPIELPCTTRYGGFGGKEGFRAYLKTNKIKAVIDATHPFAAVMSATAADICRQENLPHIQLLRPEWRPQPGDRWVFVEREKDVASVVPVGSTVFLATGRQTLPEFDNLQGRRLICRQIDPPEQPFPFDNGVFLVGRPPFSREDEAALFEKLAVDWLVVKNSGGTANRSKLDAARDLGMGVAVIRRPKLPDCHRVDSEKKVIEWLQALRGRA